MAQVTHRYDKEQGRMVQIVSPSVLRQVLDATGDGYGRPEDWNEEDEWEVEGCVQRWTCRGAVRGECGVRHRSYVAAALHCDRDARACRARGGRSDRLAVPID